MFSFDDRTRALLDATARLGSVSAAARAIGLDPSNAHRHLRAAESRAGASLLERRQGSARTRLTRAGKSRTTSGALHGRALVYDAQDGTTRVLVGRRALHVAGRWAPGPLAFSLPPEAVVLTREASASSARNAIPARVVSLRDATEGTVLVELTAGSLRLRALITRGARRELRLRNGSRVVALVKATAIVVRTALAP